jgi:hypothetical protein
LATSVLGSTFDITISGAAPDNYQLEVTNGTQAITTDLGITNVLSRPVSFYSSKTSDYLSRTIPLSAWVSTPLQARGRAHPNSSISIGGCTATLEKVVGYETQRLGEVHTYAGVTGTYTYGDDSSSSVTIGYSPTGAFGSFSASGTYETTGSISGSLTVPSNSHNYVTAEWSEGLFLQQCNFPKYSTSSYYDIAYKMQPDTFALGDVAPSNPAGGCPAGSIMLIAGGRPISVGLGSSVSYGWSVDLLGATFGEQTQYGYSAQMAYVPSPTELTYLCTADGGSPGGEAVIYNSLLAK